MACDVSALSESEAKEILSQMIRQKKERNRRQVNKVMEKRGNDDKFRERLNTTAAELQRKKYQTDESYRARVLKRAAEYRQKEAALCYVKRLMQES